MMILSLSSTPILPPLPTHFHPKRRRFPLPPNLTGAVAPLTTPPPPLTSSAVPPVLIIGAGLAGLAAATKLTSYNIPFLLLESSDSVGGRVRTDSLDGFLLDRGFQIFITSYPECRSLLDYDSLHLQTFYSGARIFLDGKFHTVADPTRHLIDSLGTLRNPIGNVIDKLLIAWTRIGVLVRSDDEILAADEVTVVERLRGAGFSDSLIDRFFRPFFGGIFFDKELKTTSRLFDFVFKCLALGDNALPRDGISAVPEQLALRLPRGSIRLNTKVISINFDEESNGSSIVDVKLESGETLSMENGVVLAVEEPEAERLLGGKLVFGPVERKPARGTVCLYFAADQSQIPSQDPVLYLNGSGEGIVNNMFFPTNVAPSYGPPGKALVSVSLIGSHESVSDDDLGARVVDELSGWFTETMVRSWRHLRTYRIRFAQPNQTPPTNLKKSPMAGKGMYLCGDYMSSATFDGALVSGRRAVEALLEDKLLVRAQ